MMKTTFARLLAAGAFALAFPLATTPSANAAEGKPLLELMESFDTAYKGFRRETDPEKALPLVRESQAAVWQAITTLPPMVEKMPDNPARAKAAATYRMMMAEVYLMLAQLELAFIERDMDAVADHVGAIRAARRTGHDQFMEE